MKLSHGSRLAAAVTLLCSAAGARADEPRHRAEPVPTTSESVVSSGLSLGVTGQEAVLARHRSRIRECHRDALQVDAAVRGAVRVAVRVGADGNVESATVDASDVPGALSVCVAAVFKSMKFPPPEAGAATITVTVMFPSDASPAPVASAAPIASEPAPLPPIAVTPSATQQRGCACDLPGSAGRGRLGRTGLWWLLGVATWRATRCARR
ncbi:MAG: AgmX/PglI C-terminal domain-containing protein [Polyangiales bacterium]